MTTLLFVGRWPHFRLWADDQIFVCEQKTTLFFLWSRRSTLKSQLQYRYSNFWHIYQTIIHKVQYCEVPTARALAWLPEVSFAPSLHCLWVQWLQWPYVTWGLTMNVCAKGSLPLRKDGNLPPLGGGPPKGSADFHLFLSWFFGST